MTVPKLQQQTLHMVAAWVGALTMLILLVSRSETWTYHFALTVAPMMAVVVAALISVIVRFKPTQTASLALCGCLGVSFTIFSFCLTYVFGR